VSDVVGRLYSMDSGIRPLYEPISRAAGCAVTVRLPPADNWALAAALTMARRDDVLVVDWMGYRDGCGSGVNSLIPAIRQGLAGVVIDGCWRDVAELRQLDFPVFGRGISAYSPPKHEFGEINVPVCCGGVIVEPGDVIVADREGVAVVPRRHATDVARSLPGTRHEIRKSVSEYPEVSPSLQRRAAAYLRSLELGGIEEVLV
jgi:regulator of RNase E activity RraA